ncbi:MAG TPA: DUF4325 domain-containing protein [Candidatus Binatia bacterium]|nr:DUF4325 domain-containing protein [Candidatus Binatia bacterium]
MVDITITLPGTDLASRKTAATVRHNVISQVAPGNRVIIDLSQIVSISYAYADELFGVLAAERSWEWFTKNLQLVGTKQSILRVIAEAINQRLKETGQPIKRSA